MRNTLFGLLAAVAFFSNTARASEPAGSAQNRAALYQREVRAALTGRGWRVTRDEAGKLTAERRRTEQNGTNEFLLGDDNKYTRLEIDFRADDKGRTVGSARASLCIYDPLSSSRVGRMAYPPLALRDPKLTQEWREVLAEAESRLADGQHSNAGPSARVAMK